MLEKPKIDPVTFFQERNQTLKRLDIELKKMAERILALVPPELENFKKEAFYHFPEFLVHLEQNSSRDSCNSDKIKEPEDYGFRDMTDAQAQLTRLKTAWKGIIDVAIIPPQKGGDWYITIEYRLPAK